MYAEITNEELLDYMCDRPELRYYVAHGKTGHVHIGFTWKLKEELTKRCFFSPFYYSFHKTMEDAENKKAYIMRKKINQDEK